MQRAGSQNSRTQVLDPNSFARGAGHNSPSWRSRGGNRRPNAMGPRGRNQGSNTRERNQSGPSNAVNSQRARTQVSPPNLQRERNPQRAPRAGLYVARRGNAPQQPTQDAPVDLSQPMDPEAYLTGRARGGKGKLWNPK
jgi:hypothetical protein